MSRPEFHQRVDGAFEFLWADEGVGMIVDRVRELREGALVGEITVTSTAADFEGHVHGPARLDLLSTEGQDRLAKVLNSRVNHVAWADLLTIACNIATDRYRRTVDAEAQPQLAAIPDLPTDVLPRPLKAFVRAATDSGLPAALVGGAALAAVAAAAGEHVQVQLTSQWSERLILWVALVAPRGAGKSPAQSLAFAPIRAHDTEHFDAYRRDLEAWQALGKADKASVARPTDARVRITDASLEALVRHLHAAGSGAAAWDLDELSKLLRGVGEYKGERGADQARLLELWSGVPWSYERVGREGRDTNAIDILIAQPTVVICGGLQTRLHRHLGGEEDGMRPRWLPHLSAMPEPSTDDLDDQGVPSSWNQLLRQLLKDRGHARVWTLGPEARRAFRAYQRATKRQSRSTDENPSTSAALVKADIQLARVLGTFLEASQPLAGGTVDVGTLERAAGYVDYVMACWRALPEQGRVALSLKDERLDGAIDRLVDWLEQHGGQATPRDIQRSAAAGLRTMPDIDVLLERYEAVFPGCVEQGQSTTRGGRRGRVVTSPPRTLKNGWAYLPSLSAADKPISKPIRENDGPSEIEHGEPDA